MPFSLLSADGQQKFDVRDGAPMLVGRAPTCDVPVFDPTISRRHAELSLVAGGVEILDLGSSNGTFVNGDRVTKTTARGGEQSRAVPQSIARQAVADKAAILSDNAGEDTRFAQGASILMQQVRSAICVPLVGSSDEVLGVLYVDNVTTTHRFSPEDMDFCIAFAGIAGTAIEREQFAQQIQREMVVRNN